MPPTLPDDDIIRTGKNYKLTDDHAWDRVDCTICDPDNDIDCGWEGKEVYMPIDMNVYFIGYSADSGGNMNTVSITAESMDEALTKWAGQFSDLFVHARTIFKYQPYSTITKVYTVMQEHTITTVTEYKVQY